VHLLYIGEKISLAAEFDGKVSWIIRRLVLLYMEKKNATKLHPSQFILATQEDEENHLGHILLAHLSFNYALSHTY
jgi:hypothetical protein